MVQRKNLQSFIDTQRGSAGAIAALEQAARISPLQTYVHQLLADQYQSVGRTEDSQRHRAIARALEATR